MCQKFLRIPCASHGATSPSCAIVLKSIVDFANEFVVYHLCRLELGKQFKLMPNLEPRFQGQRVHAQVVGRNHSIFDLGISQ